MSHRTFTQNVINLVVENCLIIDIPRILTPETVIGMTEETLKDLASESGDILSKREFLQEQARKLREGLQICQHHRRRELTGDTLTLYPPHTSSRLLLTQAVPSMFTGVATPEHQTRPGPGELSCQHSCPRITKSMTDKYPTPSTQQASTTGKEASQYQVPSPFTLDFLQDFPATGRQFSNIPAIVTPPETPESRVRGGASGRGSAQNRGPSINLAEGNAVNRGSHSSRSSNYREHKKTHHERSGSSSSEL